MPRLVKLSPKLTSCRPSSVMASSSPLSMRYRAAVPTTSLRATRTSLSHQPATVTSFAAKAIRTGLPESSHRTQLLTVSIPLKTAKRPWVIWRQR